MAMIDFEMKQLKGKLAKLVEERKNVTDGSSEAIELDRKIWHVEAQFNRLAKQNSCPSLHASN